ncbi:hypothetical protein HG535_0H00540 [Zygotorulaspora mrakii]|uniref:Nuclear fusion protein KAR5 n=1 Tax=Zygotorulaspora mrakii TaxID=42260 RepID=A0A7H9B9P9_ZYGMR|nr:uncharacterized protein HG535_0H00540 [Zygotorulaspora mrakii]QLG74729.1 hypothetical protein HG535_0H00540 [Zygotorulaspora mrakii]
MNLFKVVIALHIGGGVVRCSDIGLAGLMHNLLLSTNDHDPFLNDETLKSTFPFLKSTCAKNALEEFLPLCLTYGLESTDSTLRVETAVKLSLCEFKDSGLESIPASCEYRTSESMMDCMIELESSSQWWTTYSGNYQRLSSICYENSLPYEKEQILRLFLNITSVYEKLNENLPSKLQHILSQLNEVKDNYIRTQNEMLKENLNNLMQDTQMHRKEMKKEFDDEKDDMRDLVLHNKDMFMSEIENRDSQILEIIAHVQSMIINVETQLMHSDLPKKIEKVRIDDLRKWEELEEVSSNILKSFVRNKELINSEVSHTIENIRERMLQASYELESSQSHAVEVFKDHDDMIRNYLLPSLTDTVVEFKSTVMNEWQETSNVMNENIATWNKKIATDFSKIMLCLNQTAERVADVSGRVADLEYSLIKFLRALSLFFGSLKFIVHIVRRIIINRFSWVALCVGFISYKFYKLLYYYNSKLTLTKHTRLVTQWMLILFATYIGSKCGALIARIQE